MSTNMRAVDWLREQEAIQCHQAADYIERLERERDEWRECAEKLESFVYTPFAADEHAACAAALAEFERLKEASK
jgi:hypothetical protein